MTADLPAGGYCGPAPLPSELLARWNLDPVLIAALLLLGWLLWRQAATPGQRRAGLGGVALLALLFLTPFCALTVALFSARIAHHALLVAVAAPLLALALGPGRARLPAVLPLGLHALALWVWQAPAAYHAALTGPAAYWAMQATLGLSALWLWHRILFDAPGPAVLAAFGSMAQMGLLGALLVLSGVALYPGHAASAPAFGVSLLDDQRLGGCLMWLPVALPYLAAGLWRLRGLLEPLAEERA